MDHGRCIGIIRERIAQTPPFYKPPEPAWDLELELWSLEPSSL